MALNVAVRDVGHAKVEVLDDKNRPICGFGLKDCVPLKGDDVNQVVLWKSGKELKRLVGKTTRRRIELTDMDLYAIDSPQERSRSDRGHEREPKYLSVENDAKDRLYRCDLFEFRYCVASSILGFCSCSASNESGARCIV